MVYFAAYGSNNQPEKGCGKFFFFDFQKRLCGAKHGIYIADILTQNTGKMQIV
jgi:hypothetical protein